jgi:hypothetical protein
MQRSDVQRALGVSPKSQKFEWTACSAHLNYTQYAISVLPIYAKVSIQSLSVATIGARQPVLTCARRAGVAVARDESPGLQR